MKIFEKLSWIRVGVSVMLELSLLRIKFEKRVKIMIKFKAGP